MMDVSFLWGCAELILNNLSVNFWFELQLISVPVSVGCSKYAFKVIVFPMNMSSLERRSGVVTSLPEQRLPFSF